MARAPIVVAVVMLVIAALQSTPKPVVLSADRAATAAAAGPEEIELPGDSLPSPAPEVLAKPAPPLKGVEPPHVLGLTAPAQPPALPPLGARSLSDLPGGNAAAQPPVVALTFDDGPDPRYTPAILGILGQYGAPATFFMVGRVAAAHPELVAQVAAAGDAVEGHTWNHADLRTLPDTAYPAEVDNTDNLLTGLSGHSVQCVRPPKGSTSPQVTAQLGSRGLISMLWNVDPTDWTRPGVGAIVQRVLGTVHPGSIILMHDGGGDRSQTVAALPQILDGLRARGLTPVITCR